MPWPVIVVALVLAQLFAGLVRVLGWAPEWALLAVGGGAVGIVLLLLGGLMLVTRSTRPSDDVWRVFVGTVRKDWESVRKWFRR